MKNKRVLQFGLVGLLTALTLQLVGYRLDHAVPRVALESQMLYNWLTLFFSPVAFFLRLGNPDTPVATGWTTFFIILLSNGLLYAAFCRICQAFFFHLQYKLAHENIPVVAKLHPERVTRLASPEWKPRRI